MNAYQRIEEAKRAIRRAKAQLLVGFDMAPIHVKKDAQIKAALDELAEVIKLLGKEE